MVEIKNDSEQQSVPLTQEVSQKGLALLWAKMSTTFGLDNRSQRIIFALTITSVLLVALLSFFLIAPNSFVPGTKIMVTNGMSLGEVSLLLEENRVIKSRVIFEFCAITFGGDKKIIAGGYLFKEPIDACAVATRIVGGVFGIPTIRVTIPEGLSNKEIAAIFTKSLPQFDAEVFIDSSAIQEGYLFPDTYFFNNSTTSGDVATRMKANFDKKIKTLTADIASSGHTLNDVIIMASLLEREVSTDEDRAIVSGILWKRIAQGMPLQVDAPFMYLLNKKSSELTQSDLQIDSTYNTYRNKGLPAGPINNPGISSIEAALHPEATSYLYYLADKNGITHYAKTFDEHKANKQKYLQ